MKINQFKKYNALALTTALSLLTGCGYTGNTIESSSEITLEKENNINTDTSELEEEKNTQFVYKKGSLSFTVNVNRDTLSLQTERETEENHELPTEFYEKINEILINQNIKKIELSKIGSEIDFTKLDLSNIERLLIIDCKEGFDSTAFTGKYSAIDFIDTSNLIIERVIGNCDCSDADIFISNSLDMSGDYSYKDIVNIKKLGKYLIQNNITVNGLSIRQLGLPMTEEEISLLSQVNTKTLDIEFEGSNEVLNLDLKMNENIVSFILKAAGKFNFYSNWGSIQNRELGNVKITSINSKLDCSFWFTDITENTHLDLPELTNVELVGIDYTDIEPFYDLMNVESLTYQPFFGHLFTVQENEIIYTYQKENDNFEEFIEQVKQMYEEKIAIYQK